MKRWTYSAIALAAVIAAVAFGYRACNAEKLRAALEAGRLSPLPSSARNVESDTMGNGFARAYWLRFSADAGDLDAWLAGSPGMREVAPNPPGAIPTFDKQHAPPWFVPDGVKRGRVFELSPRGAIFGWAVIDDVNHIAFVYVSDS